MIHFILLKNHQRKKGFPEIIDIQLGLIKLAMESMHIEKRKLTLSGRKQRMTVIL